MNKTIRTFATLTIAGLAILTVGTVQYHADAVTVAHDFQARTVLEFFGRAAEIVEKPGHERDLDRHGIGRRLDA